MYFHSKKNLVNGKNLFARIGVFLFFLSLECFFAVPEGEGTAPCFLSSGTLETARDNEDRTRTKLGLAERVLVFSTEEVTWTLTDGKEIQKSETHFVLEARETLGTTKIVGENGAGKKCEIEFNVVAPDNVIFNKVAVDKLANGVVGVGLVTEVVIGPTDVSFYQLDVIELEAESEELLGWFVGPPQNEPHKKWPEYISLQANNRVGSQNVFDVAAFGAGQASEQNKKKSKKVWNIPWAYNVPSDKTAENQFFTAKQTMEILGALGSSKVTKKTESATSTLDDRE